MGIQSINAPLRQMRRPAPPAPSEDLTELAGSRAAPQTPQRQRGLWSFLTWPFVIAPIVAAEALLVGNGHALATEDQDDRAADHGREQPDVPADHDQIVAGAAHTPDDSRDDGTDAPRLIATTPKALHDADAHEDAKLPVTRDTVATESQAEDSSGGGGGGNGSGPDDNNSSDANSSATGPSSSNASPGSEIAAIGSSSELSGKNLSSLIPAEISHQIVIGDSPNWVDVLVGGESGLAHTTSAVVSTLTSSVADILSPVGLGTSININDLVNLKDVLGFDLHVNSSGEFIATDLEAALDLHPSYLIANTGSTVLSPVAEGLSALNLGTSNILDSLLGGNNHSFVGHVGNLTSIISSDDAISPIKGNPLTADLNSNGTASLEKLADAPLPNLPDFSLETGLPVVSTAPVVGAVSDLAHVSIVGEATAMTPGHSIDFSAPALPEGDVLFRGNNYTDYHVALQTTGPSAESNSIPATTISVASTHDATSLAHVDSPAVNLVASTSTVQHQDTSLTHISTTLDDLGLRSHTH
jgi:hypothetical protein